MDKKSKAKRLKAGGYSVIATCILVAILVALNALVAALPVSYTQYDLTNSELYTLSDETKDFIKGIDKDIDIFLIARSGKEDGKITRLLARYEELSSHIKVSYVDPDVYPNFTVQYTDEKINENSLIIASADNSTYVDYYQIYEYDYNSYYSTGEMKLDFAGEGAITAGIVYVVSGRFPVIYTIEGHGETEMPASYRVHIKKQNIEVKSINLNTEEIPEDCQALLLLSPAGDINSSEKETILNYLRDGGHMIIVAAPTQSGPLANVNEVLSKYKINVTYGMVVEANKGYYINQQPYYLVPDILPHKITDTLKTDKYSVCLPMSQGLTIDSTLRDGLSVQPLLRTSDSAYCKVDPFGQQTLEKRDGDVNGPFLLGIAATEGDTNLVVVSSDYLLDEETNMMVSNANEDFFISAVTSLCSNDFKITIGSKRMAYDTLAIPELTGAILTLTFCVAVPLVFLLVGIVIFIRRRKK